MSKKLEERSRSSPAVRVHRRSGRQASGRRWSKRRHYLREGRQGSFRVVKAIERAGQKAIAIQADAIEADAVAAAVEKTVATFGRLDILVNNAGTAIPKPFEETTLEEMDRVLNINVRGVFAATQAALKHMNEGGRIIMIGSAVGERAVAPGLVPMRPRRGRQDVHSALSREVGKRASRLTTSNRVRSTLI